ncbi:unnamed protein product [Ambrosiozyma monospora]|uniref:Unnamed protein product n=1 Tax=Ambrosiozyma monospora TaxID=43982 RepID=A0ACB5SWD1_AMBMO|nr:unnamed protein product [Ambrosiozyma monospora]
MKNVKVAEDMNYVLTPGNSTSSSFINADGQGQGLAAGAGSGAGRGLLGMYPTPPDELAELSSSTATGAATGSESNKRPRHDGLDHGDGGDAESSAKKIKLENGSSANVGGVGAGSNGDSSNTGESIMPEIKVGEGLDQFWDFNSW